MSTLRPGTLLENRYEVKAVIGRGGMSTVYHCIDIRLGRDVAVKVLSPEFAQDPTFRTRFLREARATAYLNSPTLVNVFDQGEDNGTEFIVMELVQGGTLRELLSERGPMPTHAALAVLIPVLEALKAAHKAGMVHRDIKPDNILISEDNAVKLADFGLVRAAKFDKNEVSKGILGTAAYLSPEQVQGGTIGPGTDIYALGIVLYEMLTGTTPFTGNTPLETAYDRLSTPLDSVQKYNASVAPEIDALVARMTALDPTQRYSDVDQLLEDVKFLKYSLSIPNFKVPAPNNSAVKAALAGEDVTARKSWDDASMATNLLTGEQATELLKNAAPQAQTSILPPSLPPNYAETQVVEPPIHSPDITPLAVQQKHSVPSQPLTNKSTGKTVAVILIIVALVASMTLGAWWFSSGRYGEVPELVGLDNTQAITQLELAGFSSDLEEEYSNEQPPGVIVSTSPSAGTKYQKSSKVTLISSLGKPAVPSIEGNEPLGVYKDRLKALTLGFTITEEVFSDTVDAGNPVTVYPTPGTTVDAYSDVEITVSKGIAPVSVPDVLGKKLSSAINQLERAGLEIGRITNEQGEEITSSAKGRVTAISPEVGTDVSKGTVVNLVVGQTISVPNFIGMTVAEAKGKASNLGINLDTQGASSGSTILYQDPLPMTNISPHQEVTVSTTHSLFQ